MFISTLFFATVLNASASVAETCPKDAPKLDRQSAEMAFVMASGVVERLAQLGATEVLHVAPTATGYRVTATNGCFVETSVAYAAGRYPGTCATLAGVVKGFEGCPSDE